MTELTENTSLGEIVAFDYRIGKLFEQHHIDYCCNGNRSLREACEAIAYDPNELLIEINAVLGMQTSESINYSDLELNELTDHIVKHHHAYVEQQSNEILPLLEKVNNVHGKKHPELRQVYDLFKEGVQELAKHMKKEELILFPFISKMIKAAHGEIDPFIIATDAVKSPIDQMMDEHNIEGERFQKINELTNGYTPPEDACNTYIRTYSLLSAFEKDLHLHIHLENNILFPKSLILQKSLDKSNE